MLDKTKNFYIEVMKHDYIYSLMYSPHRMSNYPLDEQIIKLETEYLDWFDDQTGFFHFWGWPGPDYNKYTPDTYGKGWAFTKRRYTKLGEKNSQVDN